MLTPDGSTTYCWSLFGVGKDFAPGSSPEIVEHRPQTKATRLIVRQFCCKRASGAAFLRFRHAFCCMDVAIDHLQVWQTPIIEQLGPRRGAVFAPHPKQRDAVVYLCVLPEPSASLAKAPRLQAPQDPA